MLEKFLSKTRQGVSAFAIASTLIGVAFILPVQAMDDEETDAQILARGPIPLEILQTVNRDNSMGLCPIPDDLWKVAINCPDVAKDFFRVSKYTYYLSYPTAMKAYKKASTLTIKSMEDLNKALKPQTSGSKIKHLAVLVDTSEEICSAPTVDVLRTLTIPYEKLLPLYPSLISLSIGTNEATLTGDDFDDDALGNYVKTATTLQKLILNNQCMYAGRSPILICETLSQNTGFTSLDVSYGITRGAIKGRNYPLIVKKFKNNQWPTLKNLVLRNHSCSSPFVVPFAQALITNTTLTELNLEGTADDDASRASLEALKKQRPDLKLKW